VNDSSDDQRIIEITHELCHQMDIASLIPKKVVWADIIALSKGSMKVGSDECVTNGEIVLPERIRGKLRPDEWTPIIASALAFERKLKRRVMGHQLRRFFLPGFLPLALIVLVLMISNPDQAYGVMGLLISGIIILLFLTKYLSASYVRSMRLQADRMAADLVGRDKMIDVLRKIDEMKLKDVEKRKRSGLKVRFSSRPTITERNRNLLAQPLGKLA